MTAVIDVPEGASTTLRVREPDIYAPDSRHSFFTDLAIVSRGGNGVEQADAAERIQRHSRLEQRSNPNTTLGTGGEFAPPLWLIEKFRTAAFIGRPFADLVGSMPLPAGVQSINLPKFVTGNIQGGETAVQPGQGSEAALVDPTSAALSSPVVTIAGEMDVSQQLYDLTPANPGFDAAAFLNLTNDYNASLENQLVSGTGTNGQVLGIANFSPPSGNTVNGSSATTIQTLWPLLGQVAAAVGNARGRKPEAWLMAPRRYFWIASSVDSSQRPIASPTQVDPTDNTKPAVFHTPVILEGALNTGTQPDSIYAVRPSEMLLWESAPKVMAAVGSLNGTLQVRLRLYRYVAFVGNAYTSGLGVLQNVPRPANF